VIDRWNFWGTAGEKDSPEDALQQGVCEGWADIAGAAFVARVAWVVFAAVAMLAQQSAQCIEALVLPRQDTAACRGTAQRATISIPATNLAKCFIASGFYRYCQTRRIA
jgi:hypothetical protein